MKNILKQNLPQILKKVKECLQIVRPLPKRDFSINQLAVSKINTLGIDFFFFPTGFTLNFVPILPPAAGATPAEIAARAALVLVHELADYEFPSANLCLAQELNLLNSLYKQLAYKLD